MSDGLESRISDACKKGIECGLVEPELARMYFATMAMLIRQRSPEQVERVERERGLRA
jgi:hypothetical protein